MTEFNMPVVRYYKVKQIREVRVWANSPLSAAEIADQEFNGRQDLPLKIGEGHAVSDVRYRDLIVEEDR